MYLSSAVDTLPHKRTPNLFLEHKRFDSAESKVPAYGSQAKRNGKST